MLARHVRGRRGQGTCEKGAVAACVQPDSAAQEQEDLAQGGALHRQAFPFVKHAQPRRPQHLHAAARHAQGASLTPADYLPTNTPGYKLEQVTQDKCISGMRVIQGGYTRVEIYIVVRW